MSGGLPTLSPATNGIKRATFQRAELSFYSSLLVILFGQAIITRLLQGNKSAARPERAALLFSIRTNTKV